MGRQFKLKVKVEGSSSGSLSFLQQRVPDSLDQIKAWQIAA